MGTYIAGFICALVLAALVIAWITYCMFFKEKHKSEFYQWDITDIRQKNIEISQQQEFKESSPEKKSGLSAGIFILPSRHNQQDGYEKRPDYPEGPVQSWQPVSDQLVEVFSGYVEEDCGRGNAGFEIDSGAAYQSDV